MKLPILLSVALGFAIGSEGFCLDELASDEEKSVSNWIRELKCADASARSKAANALGEFGRKAEDAVPSLLECLKDEDTHVRVSAAFALWKVERNAKVALPVLLEAMKDKKYDSR